MTASLNNIEADFVEFIAGRENRPINEIETLYVHIRQRFDCFKSKRFKQVGGSMHEICRLFYDTHSEEKTLDTYRFLAPVHILVFLSYSYPKRFSHRLEDAWTMFKKKEYSQIIKFGRKYFKSRIQKKGTVDLITEHAPSPPVVVDYGCGMAYFSSDIAKRDQAAHIYLLDIESLILDFTVFRFNKYNYNFEVLPVTQTNLYPKLPPHNICLANEIMEHVFEPLKVYDNIHGSMEMGGILFGNFSDHDKGLLHVTPDLSSLRKRISEDYEAIETKIYKKVR